MNPPPASSRAALALICFSNILFAPTRGHAGAELAETTEPPVIPIGYDAFLRWDQWPVLRLGVRAYMRSMDARTS